MFFHSLQTVTFGCVVLLAYVRGFPVSTSLNGMSGEPALLELFKYSRRFGTASTPWDSNCTVDAETGWPMQDDFGVVIDYEPQCGAKMPFSALCNAEPVFKVSPTQSMTVENTQWDPVHHMYTATLAVNTTCEGGALFLAFRNTSGGCTNISLLQPASQHPQSNEALTFPSTSNVTSTSTPTPAASFSNIYLAAVQNFDHLRMMDWGSTNSNPLEKWSERTPVDWPSYRYGRTVPSRGMAQTTTSSATGAPYEVMIDLCNAAKADCWINIPALVDDDYIQNLAVLVQSRLDPKLNIYLEYSNELWNDMFPQTKWHYNWSNASVISGDPLKLNYDNQTIGQWNCVSWSFRHTAYMLMRIGQIFGAVMGKSQVPNGRVRPVLAGQMGDGPQWEGLTYLDNVHGPPSQFIHATANAPYFAMNASSAGRGSPNCQDGWTADDVLNLLETELHKPGADGGNGYIASRDVTNPQALSAVHARWYNVRVLTYEGGDDTSCFFENPSSVPAKLMANLDPRMTSITYDYLVGHAAHGQHYGALNWFVCCATSYSSIFGQWGISNNLFNFTKAPKWLGIEKAMADSQPAPTLGVPVPGVVDGITDAVGRLLKTDVFCGGVDVFYVLNSKSSGTFKFAVNATSTGTNTSVTFAVNGDEVGTVVIGSAPPVEPVPVPGTTTLGAGVSALRMTMPATPHQCFRMVSISVTAISLL